MINPYLHCRRPKPYSRWSGERRLVFFGNEGGDPRSDLPDPTKDKTTPSPDEIQKREEDLKKKVEELPRTPEGSDLLTVSNKRVQDIRTELEKDRKDIRPSTAADNFFKSILAVLEKIFGTANKKDPKKQPERKKKEGRIIAGNELPRTAPPPNEKTITPNTPEPPKTEKRTEPDPTKTNVEPPKTEAPKNTETGPQAPETLAPAVVRERAATGLRILQNREATFGKVGTYEIVCKIQKGDEQIFFRCDPNSGEWLYTTDLKGDAWTGVDAKDGKIPPAFQEARDALRAMSEQKTPEDLKKLREGQETITQRNRAGQRIVEGYGGTAMRAPDGTVLYCMRWNVPKGGFRIPFFNKEKTTDRAVYFSINTNGQWQFREHPGSTPRNLATMNEDVLAGASADTKKELYGISNGLASLNGAAGPDVRTAAQALDADIARRQGGTNAIVTSEYQNWDAGEKYPGVRVMSFGPYFVYFRYSAQQGWQCNQVDVRSVPRDVSVSPEFGTWVNLSEAATSTAKDGQYLQVDLRTKVLIPLHQKFNVGLDGALDEKQLAELKKNADAHRDASLKLQAGKAYLDSINAQRYGNGYSVGIIDFRYREANGQKVGWNINLSYSVPNFDMKTMRFVAPEGQQLTVDQQKMNAAITTMQRIERSTGADTERSQRQQRSIEQTEQIRNGVHQKAVTALYDAIRRRGVPLPDTARDASPLVQREALFSFWVQGTQNVTPLGLQTKENDLVIQGSGQVLAGWKEQARSDLPGALFALTKIDPKGTSEDFQKFQKELIKALRAEQAYAVPLPINKPQEAQRENDLALSRIYFDLRGKIERKVSRDIKDIAYHLQAMKNTYGEQAALQFDFDDFNGIEEIQKVLRPMRQAGEFKKFLQFYSPTRGIGNISGEKGIKEDLLHATTQTLRANRDALRSLDNAATRKQTMAERIESVRSVMGQTKDVDIRDIASRLDAVQKTLTAMETGLKVADKVVGTLAGFVPYGDEVYGGFKTLGSITTQVMDGESAATIGDTAIDGTIDYGVGKIVGKATGPFGGFLFSDPASDAIKDNRPKLSDN